jgi:hypothetical protein
LRSQGTGRRPTRNQCDRLCSALTRLFSDRRLWMCCAVGFVLRRGNSFAGFFCGVAHNVG